MWKIRESFQWYLHSQSLRYWHPDCLLSIFYYLLWSRESKPNGMFFVIYSCWAMIFCVTHETVCEKSSTSLLILFDILFKKSFFQSETIWYFCEYRKRPMALNGSKCIGGQSVFVFYKKYYLWCVALFGSICTI